MQNTYMNKMLQRIADAVERWTGGSITIDVTGAGDMRGATSTSAGVHGLVPAPAAGDQKKVLSGAGTWINAGTVGELGDLEDVELTSPTSGESLKYDGAKWVNGNVTAELPDFIEETSGSMVTVEAAERPAKSLVVAINPVQSGSGDPSPENVRPISGWTGATVTRTGMNLWGGEKLADDIAAKAAGATKNATAKTITYLASEIDQVVLFERFKSNTQYTLILNGIGFSNMQFFYSDGTIQVLAGTLPTTSKEFTSYSSNSIKALTGNWSSGKTVLNYEQCGLFEGVIAVDNFTPYAGATYPIPFPSEAGTVYGGTLDVVNGVLTVTKANIASYDGETLPGAWISDRDVYSEGTTPTTGAQVVYDLGTPITYQLTPTEVQMLLGTNNIWADTGEITELKYITQTYNDLLAEMTGGGVSYSTAEQYTGLKWIDGSKIYQKTIDFGTMPVNEEKDVAHGISNLAFLVDIEFVVYNAASNQWRLMPAISRGNIMAQSAYGVNSQYVFVLGGEAADVDSNWSGIVTIRYTKSSL